MAEREPDGRGLERNIPSRANVGQPTDTREQVVACGREVVPRLAREDAAVEHAAGDHCDPLEGGRGRMVGAFTGVVLLGLVNNVLVLNNTSTFWIDAANGAIILIALGLGRLIATVRA
jgi:hypothetical protein